MDGLNDNGLRVASGMYYYVLMGDGKGEYFQKK